MITRRTMLTGSLGALAVPALAACSERSAAALEPQPRRTPAQTTGVRPTPRAVPSRAPHVTGRPTRAQVLAELGARRPREWGLHVTGTVNRGTAAAARAGLVALTFDACGGPRGKGYDARLIALLRRHAVPATLMLNTRWVAANRSLAKELASDPLFEIQSHGARHLPLSVDGRSAYGEKGTRSLAEVYDELTAGLATMQELTGKPVRWFRTGTAHCDDVAAAAARRVGTPIAGFSVNGDAGTTFRPPQIVKALSVVTGGDIVISHMNQPTHWTAQGYAEALPRLLDRGVRFAQLSTVASA